MAAGASQAEDVNILVGRESIVAAHRELLNSARREICAFDKPPYAQARPEVTEEALSVEPEWQALERNVTLRVVYHPGFDPDRLTELGLFARKGERSRTSPVPMKLILVDSHVALIPSMRSYNPGHELRVSIVRHALLVEALQWLFEAVWDAAVPIMTSVNSENDPRRQMLISMLMTGSTDSAIANTLNINVRSVRRWIAELMDELVGLDSADLARAPDEAVELLVFVRLAHDVDGPTGEDLLGGLGAEARQCEIAKAREDDPVHGPDHRARDRALR